MKGGSWTRSPTRWVGACAEQAAAAPGDCEISFWAQGGAIARIPYDAMAFNGRHAAFWVGAEAFVPDTTGDGRNAGACPVQGAHTTLVVAGDRILRHPEYASSPSSRDVGPGAWT